MIGCIPVSKDDMVAQESWRLCLQVGSYIERVKDRGGEGELSADALLFAGLWEYHGEVTNGGHAQYYENEEDCLRQMQAMQELLRSIGLPGRAELLNEFERVVIENEPRIFDLWASGDNMTAKQIFYRVDDRFAQLELREGRLQDHLRDWLVQQPWIVATDHQV